MTTKDMLPNYPAPNPLLQPSDFHLHPYAQLLFQKKWKWPSPVPASLKPKPKQTQPPPSLQTPILEWFRNLSSNDKIASIAITTPAFTQRFLTLLPLRQPGRIFNLHQQKSLATLLDTPQHPFFEKAINSLRVAWTSQPTLYFPSADIINSQMLEWLMSVTSGHIFQSAQTRGQLQQNWLWFNSKSFHSLQKWLVNQIELTIIKNYQHRPNIAFQLDELKKIAASRKMNVGLLGMKIEEYYGCGAKELGNFRVKIKEQQEKIKERKERELIKEAEMVQNTPKKKNKRKYKKKKEEKEDKQQKNEKEPSSNESPKKQVVVDIQHQPQPQAQPQVQHVPQQQSMPQDQPVLLTDPQHRPRQQSKDPNSQLPLTNQTSFNLKPARSHASSILQNNYSHKTTHKRSQSHPKSLSPRKNHILTSKRTSPPPNPRIRLFSPRVKQRKYSAISTIRYQEGVSENLLSNTNSRQHPSQPSQDLPRRKKAKQKKQNPVFAQARKTIWKRIVSRQLDNLVDQLSIQTNQLYQLKIICFQRVRVFVQSLYPMANPILFGSNAIGLSLPNSDVDILLTGLPCMVKQQACDILAQIAVQINAMGWILSCASYLNARVPIVKLQIDPSIPFLHTKRRNDAFRVYNPMAFYHLDCHKNSLPGYTIQVDITINIQGVSSVGYQSTLLMKKWIQQIPIIQRILILFKYILFIKGYNSNFKGGIGSYCLFTMIAAYLKTNKITQPDFVDICMSLLNFYGNQFDHLQTIIWLSQDHHSYISVEEYQKHESQTKKQGDQPKLQQHKKPLLRLVDPVTNTIMSNSCYEYNNIKQLFIKIHQEIIHLQTIIEQEIKAQGVGATDLRTMLQGRKGVDKWINKFQGKCGNIVKDIIHHTI